MIIRVQLMVIRVQNLISIKVIPVPLAEHIVDEVRHAVFSLLIQFEQVGVVIECRKKITVGRCLAALDAEPLLSVLQLADEPVIVRELRRIAPNEQHGADDGARLSRDDGQSRVECRLVHCPPLFVFGSVK